MRKNKKLNLKDAAIFVLFIILFLMVFFPLFASVYGVTQASSFLEELELNSVKGIWIDWAVITGIFTKLILDGRKKKNLYMTFGFSRKKYYRDTFRSNSIKALVFSFIRTIYLFVLSGSFIKAIAYENNQAEIELANRTLKWMEEHPDKNVEFSSYEMPKYMQSLHFVYDSDKVIVPILYLFISSFIIYMMLVMSKDILNYNKESKKRTQINENISPIRSGINRVTHYIVFTHVILTWLLCYFTMPILYAGRDYADYRLYKRMYSYSEPLSFENNSSDYGVIVDGYYMGEHKELIYGEISDISSEIAERASVYREHMGIISYGIMVMSVLGRHILEFVLPNGKHVVYGSVLQACFMLLLIASFVITLVVHKKKSLKITDWIG